MGGTIDTMNVTANLPVDISRYQPPALTTETQRNAQAQVVKSFVDSILALDANAKIVVAGDLNDFEFSTPLNIVRGSVLHAMIETLPQNERYSYNFDGNAQAIDHILLSNYLFDNAAPQFDVVHINSEYATRASDHDPPIVRLTLKADTTTMLVGTSVNPSVYGQGVTFTARVTSTVGTPTGTVSFVEGTTTLGSGTLDASGIATATVSSLSVGTHVIAATYGGDMNFKSSESSPGSQGVNPAETTTQITAHNPDPSLVAQTVIVTFTVTPNPPGAGTPTGVVTVTSTMDPMCVVPVTDGKCTFTFNTAGVRTLTATYGGDTNFNQSTSAGVNHTVKKETFTSVSTSPNPSWLGDMVTITATVQSGLGNSRAPRSVIGPSGTVTFRDGGALLKTVNASGGYAIFMTNTLTAGIHNLAAEYGGNTEYNGSTSANYQHTVNNPVPTLTAISPATAQAGGAGFTLTLTGTNFANNAVVQWNGAPKATTFVNSNKLTATILASDIATAGTRSVTVINPPPGGGTSNTANFTVLGKLFLPLIQRAFVNAPDLIVQSITATPNNIQVVIQNQGPAAVVDEFWVDVYINPNPAPTRVNQTWNMLSSQGLVWSVTSNALPIRPNDTRTLTIGDRYYQPPLSNFAGNLPIGTRVYAQVDSANADTTYGAVLENHEITGDRYNNITWTTVGTASLAKVPPPAKDQQPDLSLLLPRRP